MDIGLRRKLSGCAGLWGQRQHGGQGPLVNMSLCDKQPQTYFLSLMHTADDISPKPSGLLCCTPGPRSFSWPLLTCDRLSLCGRAVTLCLCLVCLWALSPWLPAWPSLLSLSPMILGQSQNLLPWDIKPGSAGLQLNRKARTLDLFLHNMPHLEMGWPVRGI